VGFAELIISSLQIDISALTFKSWHHVTLLKSCQGFSWVAEPYGLNTEKLFCLPGCQGVTPLGRVVRKPVNANPGLKVNRGINFSCTKVLSTANVL